MFIKLLFEIVTGAECRLPYKHTFHLFGTHVGRGTSYIHFISPPPLERMVESRYFYAGLCTNNLFPPNHACVAVAENV